MKFNDHKKLTYLKWFDIALLTIIFWGSGIISSTGAYIVSLSGTVDIAENSVFTTADNYRALLLQMIYLAAALIYLRLRNFDFSQWKIRFSIKAVFFGALIFIGAALSQDIYNMIFEAVSHRLPFPGSMLAFFGSETFSTVVYSLFNGAYEEIYFLGICLCVRPGHIKWLVPFSLLVRMSFHTYQGMPAAFGIGVIFGLYMFFIYKSSKSKNLLPFFFAHALGDIFGLGILWFFEYPEADKRAAGPRAYVWSREFKTFN